VDTCLPGHSRRSQLVRPRKSAESMLLLTQSHAKKIHWTVCMYSIPADLDSSVRKHKFVTFSKKSLHAQFQSVKRHRAARGFLPCCFQTQVAPSRRFVDVWFEQNRRVFRTKDSWPTTSSVEFLHGARSNHCGTFYRQKTDTADSECPSPTAMKARCPSLPSSRHHLLRTGLVFVSRRRENENE